MSDGEGDHDGDGTTTIVGRPVAEAAAAVAARSDTPDDEDRIAATLRTVSEDGVVSLDAVDDAIADASMYLSTAEGRVEFAAVTVADAREAVADVTDMPFVESRLAGFEARVDEIEADAEALAEDLQSCIDTKSDPEHVFETARELGRIKNEADELQARADQLKAGVDEFTAMVDDLERGFVELVGDLNALDGFLDDLVTTIGELSTVLDGQREAADGYDPARVWFEATVRHRLNGLVFDDVRAELESIRDIADVRGVEDLERDTDVEERLTEVRERWADVRDELAVIAPDEWQAEYGDRIDEVEARTAEAEPPIDWDAVEADLGAFLSTE